ncbi:Lrp/AsnC family transcriptional regulator [Arthrobacter woluwensis]|uniref:Lrp/AsnC family transcriptional regulator n=1 Tax=Arthrobacter woluwensis TaxID=156980 RepID=UPI0038276604
MNRIQLSAADRRILAELSRDGRLSNKELAARVGLPRSTCHGRVRALEEAGVIRGYHADIDPEAVGTSVEAMIFVSVHSNVRNRLPVVANRLRSIPGVQRIYLIGGDHDFVLHIACESVPALRDFIKLHLGSDPDLGRTETQIIFEQHAGKSTMPGLAGSAGSTGGPRRSDGAGGPGLR